MKQIYLSILLLGGMLMSLLPMQSLAQTSQSVNISDGGNRIDNRIPMNWELQTSRSQLYYPGSMLNLPVGTKLTAISFTYWTGKDVTNLGSGGDLKISLGECSEIPDNNFWSGQLDLCYNGPHLLQLTNDVSRTVTYTFSNPYIYQGGCLVIDVSNAGSPRTVTNTSTWFKYSDISDARSLNNEMNYMRSGSPDITFQFEQTGSAPILYLPYTMRSINCGSVDTEKSYDFSTQISNIGNKVLTIEPNSQSGISNSSVSIQPGEKSPVSFTLQKDQKCVFSDVISVKSNGGTANVNFIGTTYRLKRASSHAELSNKVRLAQYGFDPMITELSLSGKMEYDDWRYLCETFRNLRYLNLSEASYFSNNFPATYGFQFESGKVLQSLALPMNVKYVYNNFFSEYQITNLRKIIFPVGFEAFRVDLTSYPLLKTIISFAITPPSVKSNTLGNISEVFVPSTILNDYENSYEWRNKSIFPITEAVLNQDEGLAVLDFEDGDRRMDETIINYRQQQSRTQLYFSQEVLNLPKGTKIKSLRLKFNVYNYNQISAENGNMRISVAETDEPVGGAFVESGMICYEGSDLLDFSISSGKDQVVIYQFDTPYEYKGGRLILDFVSTTSRILSDYNLGIRNYTNRIENIQCVYDYGNGYPSFREDKPNVGIEISTEGIMEPIPYIPYTSRNISLGYANIAELSQPSFITVQNLGGSPLVIEPYNMGAFKVEGSEIPANSTSVIEVRFIPDRKDSFEEKIELMSNRGYIPLRFTATSFRQMPYAKEVFVEDGKRLEQLISNPEEITELSVFGKLEEYDLYFLESRLSNLRYLDLSTATIPAMDKYSLFSEKLEQLALPSNLKTLRIYQNMPLSKLILPVGLKSIDDRIPEQLTALISFAVTPPKCDNWNMENIQTVYVPEWAIVNYQNDNNWSRKEIKPITDEILSTDWTAGKRLITIQNDKIYNEWDYPRGNPNIIIMPNVYASSTASLINQAPLSVDTLVLANGLNGRYANSGDGTLFGDYSYYSSFVNQSDLSQISHAGYMLQVQLGTWHYLSFPFDVDIADILRDNSWEYIFRYYDGNARAQNGTGNSWKNVTDGKLKAGTGYIFQGELNAWSEGAMGIVTNSTEKINAFFSKANKTISMATHLSGRNEDKSWNFVGNPYPSFFDIHKIEYDAPIVIWNGDGYIALSLQDDNYALRPLEAFFTQKPKDDPDYGMTFKQEGRQINATIVNMVTRASTFSNRRLINLTLGGAEYMDRSRVVINPDAKMDYELTCDAAKWMSPNPDIPQLYSLDDTGRQYAINERPEGLGKIALGIYVGKAGHYTLALSVDEKWQSVILKDNYLNKEVDLSESDYTFRAEVGTFDDRFQLLFLASGATNTDTPVSELSGVYVQGNDLTVKAPVGAVVQIYKSTGTLQQALKMTDASATITLPAGFYLIKIGDKTHKVIIH